eukprot:TRINITY_DN11683_c0_g1_i10.p1 TRINITY_DN11683_c0_g1~~TRINITY_DN11683_c0_g1_i10.p1  ORF type:complete len:288 (-),score=61.36 TRINITY_DN11683_c0_g1_i10:483-1346(-)
MENETSFCTLCQVTLPNRKKLVSQHFKSKSHKVNLKFENNSAFRTEQKDSCGTEESTEEDELEQILLSQLGNGILVSPLIHPGFTDNIFVRFPERASLLPPIIPVPSKKDVQSNSPTPFLTLNGGAILEVPMSLEHMISLYLSNDGQKEGVPNIDINGNRVTLQSWKHARNELRKAEQESLNFWATCIVPDLVHPKWYNKKRSVPTYEQIIIANAGSGIGLHIDTYRGKKVATYLTIYAGLKHVILLPPNGSEFHDFFGEDSSKNKLKPFPFVPTHGLIERIRWLLF